MFDWAKEYLFAHKTIALIVLIILVVTIAYAIGNYSARQNYSEKPTVMTQEETKEAKALRNELAISKANADALQKRLADVQAEKKQPTATYYVTAPTVERAAQVVERQIKEDAPTLPRAAREKSDRTVVTPITKDKDGKDLLPDEQKVDVYKINLRKDHRIKAGASVIDGKALMSIGYEQGRFEALTHFDGQHYKGATVMYNIVEW